MNTFAELTDKRLTETIARLERDVEDFERRAGLQKTLLERQERPSAGEPLYQRLTSIRDHVRIDLGAAKKELERRRRESYTQPGWSLRSALAALFSARA